MCSLVMSPWLHDFLVMLLNAQVPSFLDREIYQVAW